jgi:hypothetical protein
LDVRIARNQSAPSWADRNNLAAAVTILLGSSIQVITQQEIGDDESVDLLHMVNDNIASTPDFKKMTDEQRTAAYDAFLIMGALIVGLDASAKETNAPALATLARELAMNSLAQFGFKAPTAELSPQAAPVSNPVSGSVAAATLPATPQSNANGMLDGIFSGLSSALRVSTGGGLTGDPSRSYVTFHPDGKVYRRVPEGGLEGWDRVAAEADSPALWGTYRPIGSGRWEIRWNETSRVGIVNLEGNGLRYEDATVFPVATCKRLVLDGRYLHPGGA